MNGTGQTPGGDFTMLQLLAANAELRARLEEAEETLRAIRSGEVDAFVVHSQSGAQIFTLQGTEAGSNQFRGDILAQISDAVVAVDNDQNVTYLNLAAERQYGVTASEALGRNLRELWTAQWSKPADEAASIAALRDTGRWRGEGIHRKHNGETIHVESAMTRLHDGAGTPIGMLATIRDITERRRLEDALRARATELARADRNKDEFLAMLAHELRNPLAPLHNAAEMLMTPDATIEERAQAQDILRRQIGNMTRIIDDLLDVARITEGKIELRRQPVALAPLLTATADLARHSLVRPHQVLTVSLPAEPVFLHADATRLEQVLVNLLGNACKYSGEDSHIWLSAERVEGAERPKVAIRVRDDGIGITPELLPHIFDLFVQGSRTLDRAHGGLGIGLALVQRLVKLHGGSIEARSDGAGKGAEFILRLPILREAPPLPPAPALADGPATTHRILIVEDHRLSAQSIAMLLRRRGHDTRVALTGPDALAMAKEFIPDVVLLDIGLPGMDGFEVARRLRTTPRLANVFLVALSGYTSDLDHAHAKAAGFDQFMSKPANFERLQEWLRNRHRTGAVPVVQPG
jgi:PAS domain S-box-containing protein